MINDLMNEIKRQLNKEYSYVSQATIERNLIALFMLKHYCDTSKLSYEAVIKNENSKEIQLPDNFPTFRVNIINNTKLLAHIQYENLQDLIKEFINNDNEINTFNQGKNKICIFSDYNKNLYDITGKTTYVVDKLNESRHGISYFEFFDEVLGLDNKYVEYKDLILEDYNYVYIYENTPKYRYIKNGSNDVYELIGRIISKNNKLKVLLHTDYKKISNIKESRLIMRYMSKVLLLEDGSAFIYYEKKDDNKVSIINYDKNKVKSFEKLIQIIENDRKIKDVLVKTTVDDIVKNYYRIGFRLYQTGIEESVRNINEIADENTKLIDRLSELNKSIEQEINKLINR